MEAIAGVLTLSITAVAIAGLCFMLYLMRGVAWGIWWLPLWVLLGLSCAALVDVLQVFAVFPNGLALAVQRIGFRGCILIGVIGRDLWMVNSPPRIPPA